MEKTNPPQDILNMYLDMWTPAPHEGDCDAPHARTTIDIIDDLCDIVNLGQETVAKALLERGYKIGMSEGRPVWLMWPK